MLSCLTHSALYFTLALNVFASNGDYNPEFQICTADCMAKFDCPVRSDYFKWTQKPCFE